MITLPAQYLNFALAALLLALTGCVGLQQAPIRQKLGGRDLSIPARYYSFWYLELDQHKTPDPRSIELTARWPDFSPSRTGFLGLPKNAPDDIDIGVIGLGDHERPMEVLFARFASRRADREPYPPANEHGLLSFDVKWSPGDPVSRLYFTQPDKDVVDLIHCAPKSSGTRCTHSFNNGGLHYQVNYGTAFLPRWREIRDGAVRLIDGFRVPAS